ncbi:hypothetical protein [Fluviicola sp.]|uniref:hypothetical protein n=1 Tax=Fluviicola sp. TaxID=1917219 RepID=UPI00260290B0|nr:hypothetical protein [Fluviicola sp.]
MLPHIGISAQEQEEIHLHLKSFFKNDQLEFLDQLAAFHKAELELVEKYGQEGLLILLDTKTQVYVSDGPNRSLEIMHYTAVPETCPWHHLHELPRNEAIRKAWENWPIDFVKSLEEYCVDLFAVFENNTWFLIYPYLAKNYDDTHYYAFLGGSQPHPDAQLPKELLEAGWNMPHDLKELYAVHGHFGNAQSVLTGDRSDNISPAEKLETSLTFLEEYVDEWEADYSFFELLPFHEDSCGNSQNFFKPEWEVDTYSTVDWDHETKEISGRSSLAEFIDHRFGESLRGE